MAKHSRRGMMPTLLICHPEKTVPRNWIWNSKVDTTKYIGTSARQLIILVVKVQLLILTTWGWTSPAQQRRMERQKYGWILQVSHGPDSKVYGANMGPIWGRQDPGGPHVGPVNFAIWECFTECGWVLKMSWNIPVAECHECDGSILPSFRECTDGLWIPFKRGQWCSQRFHVMTSSWGISKFSVVSWFSGGITN